MQEITVKFADSCKKEYHVYMKHLGVDTSTDQTNCVCFKTADLKAYFDKYDLFNNSDEIKFFFGVYPKHDPHPHHHAKPGRLTTIIWPYKDGAPSTMIADGKDGGDGKIQPYNFGQFEP